MFYSQKLQMHKFLIMEFYRCYGCDKKLIFFGIGQGFCFVLFLNRRHKISQYHKYMNIIKTELFFIKQSGDDAWHTVLRNVAWQSGDVTKQSDDVIKQSGDGTRF